MLAYYVESDLRHAWRELRGELAIDLGAVGDEHQLVIAQLRVTPHLDRQHHHRQRCARSLCGPDEAALVLLVAPVLR